ncbi:BTB/POZ domain-containing protein [Hibiscus syriacus]|uniref:BTB/POZ domain-containing protein n=1 Tax=Hibiscus syriacus TaxID=106335 RepID=A0A6A3AW57_HIBSY|nr:BTB/POZ domain-containing protein [Hibiscus syriacus]
MNGFSDVDGFVEITESLAEMIKFGANEPSVGLFYIQQHTENAVPNLVNLHDHVVEESHQVILHIEDSEDSITMVRSMKECELDSSNYFSTVIKVHDTKSNCTIGPLSVASASTSSIPDTEADELPVSSQMANALNQEDKKEETEDDVKVPHHNLSFYDDFKAEKEAKLEQWLQGSEGKNG